MSSGFRLCLLAFAATSVLCACQSSESPTTAAAPELPKAASAQVPASAAAAEANPADIIRQTATRRAAEAAIWGMPAVNYDLMRQQMLSKTQGKENQVIYWGRPLDWHNQTLTPNPDTIYFMAFFNTKDVGPIVLEIPPAGPDGSLNANIVNVWQMPLEDAGGFGVDQGEGIKLLIVPPGYKDKVPAGYEVLDPGSYGSYALLRSNLASHADADVARSIAYGKRAKVYPLSQASQPPDTVFTDVQNVDFDSTIRYDDSFYENLNRVVQFEPWLNRDRAMIDTLKSIGIEQGKPFQPDATTKQAMSDGIRQAQQYLAMLYDKGFPTFFDNTHWMYPTQPDLMKAAQNGFADPNQYPLDTRGMAYTYAYIALKRLGTAQFYLIATKDRSGANLDGSKTYRLHVPANAPVKQYWSVTAYDRQTHALIKNMDRASRASNNQQVAKNDDGSIDLYFGPKAPQGKDGNWVPTDPQRDFELMFRAYGPEKAFFDKQWTLTDLEPVP